LTLGDDDRRVETTVVGLDCEMVGGGRISVLAWCSVVTLNRIPGTLHAAGGENDVDDKNDNNSLIADVQLGPHHQLDRAPH
jgi:hypothetical protein